MVLSQQFVSSYICDCPVFYKQLKYFTCSVLERLRELVAINDTIKEKEKQYKQKCKVCYFTVQLI